MQTRFPFRAPPPSPHTTTCRVPAAQSCVRGKPLLVCANKQDVAGAMSADDLSDHLALSDLASGSPRRCVGCAATGKGAHGDAATLGEDGCVELRDGMAWLLRTAGLQYAAISSRVARDTEEHKRRQQQKLEERRARVAKQKEERRREEEAAAKEKEKETDEETETKTGTERLRVAHNSVAPAPA